MRVIDDECLLIYERAEDVASKESFGYYYVLNYVKRTLVKLDRGERIENVFAVVREGERLYVSYQTYSLEDSRCEYGFLVF